jgi:hypothetical protein
MKYTITIAGLAISLVFYGAYAADLSGYKQSCSDIGFKAGTEKHGECVLKLYERSKRKQQRNDQVQRNRIEEQQREILARQQRIEELNGQRIVEAQRLREKADTQRRLDGLVGFFQGLSMMGGGQPAPSYGGSNKSATGFLKNQRVSGFNRICTYNAVGGDKTLTVGATDLCPLLY